MLSRSGESAHPCLVLEFSRRISAFHQWVLRWLWDCCKWLLLCNDMFPLYPLWCEFFSWMNVEFCQMIFLHLMRWSWFLVMLMWCITLICICWTTFMTLEWIQLGNGVLSFLHIAGFSMLIFCWGFCIYIHQRRYWPVIFFFCSVFVWFGIRVMIASYNKFHSVPSSSIFWNSLRMLGISSSLYVW